LHRKRGLNAPLEAQCTGPQFVVANNFGRVLSSGRAGAFRPAGHSANDGLDFI
jgi:hypothetical protein